MYFQGQEYTFPVLQYSPHLSFVHYFIYYFYSNVLYVQVIEN